MAQLSGPQIAKEIAEGRIKIDPYDPVQLGANSYDLRLDKELLVYQVSNCRGDYTGSLWFAGDLQFDCPSEAWCLDMAKDNPTNQLTIPEKGLILLPGVLYLGSTVEYTETPHHVPTIETRSSVARLGISAHLSAGFGDQNFCGTFTLEISVIHPVRVYAGVRIAQIAYQTVIGEAMPYKGKYQGQRGPKSCQMWRELNGNKS